MVSVVVPAFNRRRYLRLAVRSLLAENIPGMEIIVVDDGSNDGTLDTVSDLPVNSVRFEENRGPSAARNAGIRAATQNYIAFLDSDDLLVPEGLRWRVAYLEGHPGEKGVLGIVDKFIDGEGKPNRNEHYDLGRVYADLPERIVLEDGRRGFQFPCPVVPAMFRADVFREIGDFDESLRLAEDQDFLCRFLKRYSLPAFRRPVFQYRVHDQNASIRAKQGYLYGTAASEALRILVLRSHGLG